MLLRLLRTIMLLLVGAVGGFAGAAALLRGSITSRGDATSDELSLVAIFDGIQLASRSTAFRGGTILAWFGGIDLDLSSARLSPGATLEVRAMFGGVAIRVPAEWRIDAETSSIAGGIEVPSSTTAQPAGPVLMVRATSVLGGIAITRR